MADILFYGDPHGTWRPLKDALATADPAAVVLLGDCDLERPLQDELGRLKQPLPPVFFIAGNHEADAVRYFDHLTLDEEPGGSLHGRVVDIGGLRVAGLDGVFDPEVWHPDLNDGEPLYATREQYLWGLSPEERWRDGLPLKRRVAIWYEDYEALFDQSCDILVIHDAPPPHRYGQQPFADLAEAMGARLIVHGHHHERYDAETQSAVRVLGLGKADPFLLDAGSL